MPGNEKVLKYGDREKYDALVEFLRATCEQANCGTVAWTRLCDRFRYTSGKAELTGYLHLRDWKWRGASASERVHILAEIQETVRCSDRVLLKSTVRLDYYSVADDTAELLQCVHFDFEGEKDNHPIFHVQCRKDPIVLDASIKQELAFEYDIKSDHVTCFRDARVPTSDMTFPSVLLCLAADHFAKPFFCEFREKAKQLQQLLPQPVFKSLADSLSDDPDHLRSSHWFAHTK